MARTSYTPRDIEKILIQHKLIKEKRNRWNQRINKIRRIFNM